VTKIRALAKKAGLENLTVERDYGDDRTQAGTYVFGHLPDGTPVAFWRGRFDLSVWYGMRQVLTSRGFLYRSGPWAHAEAQRPSSDQEALVIRDLIIEAELRFFCGERYGPTSVATA
jgi:hypothetical protein